MVSYIERKQFDDSANIMIGDVLDWIDNNIWLTAVWEHFKRIDPKRQYRRKPINDQPIECIEYIYNLI